MDNDLEEIKRHIDIVEFIGSYVTLKKSGANYKGLCPFHSEKTPSFMVSAEKQIFKCFGCNEGGDVFSFLMKVEGLGFGDALKTLAERAGVKLKPRHFEQLKTGEQPGEKSRMYELNDLAARLYHKILLDHPSGKPALEYLTKRGITKATIDEFMLGWAPQSWDLLIRFAEKHKFSEKEIIIAGLSVRKNQTLATQSNQRQSYDRFRERITIPINNVLGSTVAFTGRLLVDQENSPKYLNSSESPVYHKSATIYGLDKAKMAIKREDRVIIVEGNMDVIACHQAGFTNVVAVSGTALTAEMLTILSRYTNNLLFSFDNDTAGVMAMKRAISMAGEQDLNAKIIILPSEFKDPDEAIKKDPNIFKQAIESAKPALEHLIDLSSQNLSDIASKKNILKEILPIVKLLKSQSEQEHYFKILSTKLLITEQILKEEMKKSKEPSSSNNAGDQSEKPKQKISHQAKLLAVVSQNPEVVKGKIIKALEALVTQEHLATLIEAVIKDPTPNQVKKVFATSPANDQLKQIWLSVSGEISEADGGVEKYADDLAGQILDQAYEEKKSKLIHLISEADQNGDKKERLRLLKELNSVIVGRGK